MQKTKILTLNSGSSSLKFSIYPPDSGEEAPFVLGHLDRIGITGGNVKIDVDGREPLERKVDLPDHATAIQYLFDYLKKTEWEPQLGAIGHRVVMGGPRYARPQRVTPDLMQELHDLCKLDPLHMQAAVTTMEAAQKFYPKLLQVACFDTSFHRTLPRVAQTYALPRNLVKRLGLLRYGFHGLSYEYILTELLRINEASAKGKVVIAHLGNGASMAALKNGISVETTMGFTPAGGLVMSSRPGDLDPGVLVRLMSQLKLSEADWNELIYKESGLRGVSDLSSDMQDLLRARNENSWAEDAIELFCYQAMKSVAALTGVLQGLETLVFTGGIGENADFVRSRICHNLSYLGLEVDEQANQAHAGVISTVDSRVVVRVIKTNEEKMIARHVEDELKFS